MLPPRYLMNPLVVAAIFAAAPPGISFGQTNVPIKTTICELVKTPERFSGKMVQFRADFVSRFEWEGFVDEGCAAKLQVGVFHPLDGLRPQQGEYAFTTMADDNTHPERLNWKPIPLSLPIKLKKDQTYQAFRKYADAKFRWPDGGVCLDCPLYRITVTGTARFDYFETQTVAIRANPATKAFHYSAGEPNDPLSRLVLESVSDMATTPIDPFVYSGSGRRTVSLEEAHDLVYAFICPKHTCILEPFHDPDKPDFLSFQALKAVLTGSGNMGFYEVDPKTADVWNGVICERLESRSLFKLQRVIRKRIGLSDEAHQKTTTIGPMCEPGMPRGRDGK